MISFSGCFVGNNSVYFIGLILFGRDFIELLAFVFEEFLETK